MAFSMPISVSTSLPAATVTTTVPVEFSVKLTALDVA